MQRVRLYTEYTTCNLFPPHELIVFYEQDFYNLMFTLRWLIQQCLSAQHMWLPVTPLCKPFVNPYGQASSRTS
jgi:hypothetical protein